MRNLARSPSLHLVAALSIALAAAAACGGGNKSFSGASQTDAGDDGASSSGGGDDGGNGFGDGGFGTTATLQSIAISPPTATVTSLNDAKVTQAFKLQAQYSDGSVVPIASGASWTSDAPQVGGIDGAGLYTATGALGGVVNVAASYKGHQAKASLAVKLVLQQNAGNVPPGVQGGLQGASAKDPNVVWAYPYDGTVWPRGLLAPILQWNGGAATDDYYVHVVSATFELQLFTTATNAPSSRLPLDATTWEKMTDSTAGAAKVTVARWDGSADTLIASQTWSIAPASARGTIYYWSNNLGRVLRIQPGAAKPDDFADQAPLTTQYQQDSCLMTCHTVSADGSMLVSGGGTYAGSYSLTTDQPVFSLGGTWGVDPNSAGQPVWQNIQWEVPALSPDGKYVLTDSMAQNGVSDYSGPSTVMGLFTTADGKPVATSGVQGMPFAAPAWSPEGSRVAYVGSGDPSTWNAAGYNWQNPPPGALEVIQFDASKNPMFSGAQSMVAVGTGKPITWPTVSPDGKWIVYSRADSFDTRNGRGDLYLASAVTPNQEVRLARIDGDGYPFAAGARDLSYNYEPSFAPVAAGGYFWVVFTSRRTYGNVLTGQAEPCTGSCASDPSCATDSCASTCACSTATEVKQLWIAAIDQNPKPGADPSHAAFHLTGQDESNLAMRGFYSLPPCKQNGQTCTSGTDCCGGYCQAGDAGTGTCGSTSTGCSQTGDKCNTTADCCSASTGVTCINHVCSEPTPQ